MDQQIYKIDEQTLLPPQAKFDGGRKLLLTALIR